MFAEYTLALFYILYCYRYSIFFKSSKGFEHNFVGSLRKTKISVFQKTINLVKNSIPHPTVYHKACGIIFLDVIRPWHSTLSYNDRGESHFSCV